jgi:hypothetical protein
MVFQTWRELFRIALSETNRARMPARTLEAEESILSRIGELSASHVEEVQEERTELEHALASIRALRYCMRLKTSGPSQRPSTINRGKVA